MGLEESFSQAEREMGVEAYQANVNRQNEQTQHLAAQTRQVDAATAREKAVTDTLMMDMVQKTKTYALARVLVVPPYLILLVWLIKTLVL